MGGPIIIISISNQMRRDAGKKRPLPRKPIFPSSLWYFARPMDTAVAVSSLFHPPQTLLGERTRIFPEFLRDLPLGEGA